MTGAARAGAAGASYITPRLYMGRAPMNGAQLASLGFTDLVLCAAEFQPDVKRFPGVQVHRCPLDDSLEGISGAEKHRALQMGAQVAALLRAGRRVLVTCIEGRNRSGLVVALALLCLTGPDAVEWAIAYVRDRRDRDLPPSRPALVNPAFVAFLRTLRPAAGQAMMAR